ncbi:lysine-specific demethylase JMJ31 isoform X1 [Corylus avellana]|uniref:lysine-specific demethylase JMJ31 isoform X1 n=1 Tax=Corylus avellana TaxID=13451 RepID=UPI00286B8F18|nr:lysine-specific demethylase JMJ31 isoform X1 [Corylus avellana]
MDDSVRVQRFEEPPSSIEFESLIELRNAPAVFTGCVKDWAALAKWNPSNGGLNYLQERAGSCIVEAMLSRSAPVFNGDLRSHERIPLPFSTFIGYCKQQNQNKDYGRDVHSELEEHGLTGPNAEHGEDAPGQIYLAQVPIMNVEDEERVQLEILRGDTELPAILERKPLASINLWMNNAEARSSTHYDPHHNLLCIVAGRKQVVLWPPSASPMLYPMPIYGEASNHSSVALENPDFSIYPRAEFSMEYSQKVVLHAGDALFIPEGWFHQVDSDNLTIAVNFWWRSNVMTCMLEHMDAYYLRRILRRLTDKEMDQVLNKTSSAGIGKMKRHVSELPSNGKADYSGNELDLACEEIDLKGKELQHKNLLELEPFALQVLHELVSLVHDHVNVSDQSQPVQSTFINDSAARVKGECKEVATANLFHLDDDPVAKILSTLEPSTLQHVFLAIAHNFPRTLEALIVHLLSPVGAEVLTRKFDEMDQQITEEDRNKFYQVFYGAFDDQFTVMDAILNGKESFALQAFKNVLDKFMGVNLDGPKPKAGD